jgi:hypothetical protein
MCRSGKKIFTFFLFYFIIFSLPNTYMHIKPYVALAWSSSAISRHDQHRLGSAIASKIWQRHHATTNIALAAPSPARLSSVITSMTQQ